MKTFLIKSLTAALLSLVAAGCVDVDYVGQTFDPIPEGTPVAYFEKRKDIPPGKYRIIGRAIISTSRNLADQYDIRELLVDEARKRGADAVLLKNFKIVRRSVYEYDNPDAALDVVPANKSSNVKPGGEPLEVSFDREKPLRGEHYARREIRMRVLFLKDREALEQQLARRGRELDQLVKQPDPAQKVPAEKDAEPSRP